MKKTLSILFSIMFMSTALFSYSTFAKNEKVAICHYLGDGNGNPEFIVIVVSERAVASYSRHGDQPLNINGECGDGPLPPQ